jgi:predicted nucleic acid-binding protein
VIVVSNASPLIALAKIGRLDLLPELFESIIVPQAVYDEVVTSGAERPGVLEIRQASWIKTRSITDQSKVSYLLAELDRGEAEALVLAEEVSANWVLLDETKARLVAELVGLHYIGTVGLLLLAKQLGKLAFLRPVLDELRANQFYISQKVYQAVLEEAGE